MPDRVLITMEDLEAAVRANAAFEQAGARTTMVSALDDLRSAIKRSDPDLILLTGGLREQSLVRSLQDVAGGKSALLGLAEETDENPEDIADSLGLSWVLVKPVNADEVLAMGRRLIERKKLQLRTGILGEDPSIHEVLVKIEQMAPVSSTVLIQGESGTGKELVAKAIHDLSPRRGKAFIAVNCAAIPDTLLESELFGHEKGAFTGAAERRVGMFELADGGTIFLDEVGEMAPATQVKLLRVLEEREFFRVGGAQAIKVDVRVVAATNRPLRELMETGVVRADLYYRLNVLSIYLPPLRERPGDVPILVRRFSHEFSGRHERPFKGVSAEAMDILVGAPWPGNVRQLRNLIESMVVLAPEGEIRPGDIPPEIRESIKRNLPVVTDHAAPGFGGQELQYIVNSLLDLRLQVEDLRRRMESRQQRVEYIDVGRGEEGEVGEVGEEGEKGGDGRVVVGRVSRGGNAAPSRVSSGIPVRDAVTVERGERGEVVYAEGMKMADVERAAIASALKATRGNRRKAAEMLGIGERTLYRKLKEYHLDVEAGAQGMD